MKLLPITLSQHFTHIDIKVHLIYKAIALMFLSRKLKKSQKTGRSMIFFIYNCIFGSVFYMIKIG